MNGGWRCSGASVQGQSHCQSDTPCQDAQGWVQFGDTVILACADGAGSALHADKGSLLAVDSALTSLTRHVLRRRFANACHQELPDHEAILKKTFANARRELQEFAAESNIPLEQLATTLLVVVVGPEYTAAGQVGDGAIVCALDDGTEILGLTKPYQGLFVNEAVFITQEIYEEHLQISVLETPATNLALFSDGLEPIAIKYATGEPFPNLFQGLFKFMNETHSEYLRRRALTTFLSGDRLAQRSDDDKTLVLATNFRSTDKEPSPCV